MIVVTGATGRLGSQVVERLLERVPADSLGVSVRDAARAAHLAGRGVRVREADFTRPATLGAVFEGADTVLVVSPSIAGPGAAAASRAAVDHAVAAGARRILYTSHQAASPDSRFAAQPTHAAVEEHLREVPARTTALRHGFYASTLERYAPRALETGELRVPEDGPFSWSDHADLAEADAVALTDPGTPDGPTPPLTAPDLLDLADVARVLTDLTGRTVRRVVVDDEEWVADQVALGVPRPAAEFVLGMFRAARRGDFAVAGPFLEELIGRRPVSVRESLDRFLRTLPARSGSGPVPGSAV
ncbi:NAD(P)H-binding protein [Promicromonospora citrea]|uniref:NmrA family transcriptional regulator n=1 Tax=Promicromonospora citrea TaxID=43677 RepID=A0A8H9GQN7_9MICO|nr:NAD(P)H-binding protein [Promicromonospora citrea]NNH54306.1 NAD(P)H-binding protein [Promicromonospora citrea]GGM38208.1 NmrA family transcriptional regulator [Promicromonospora citrea]